MGLFDAFFGKSQKRDLRSGKESADRYMQKGYDEAAGIGADYYGRAQNYLQPFIERGNRAGGMYDNALGVNGPEAQQQFMTRYGSSDPFRQQNMDAANQSIRRTYNARGMDTSGNALLAAARASQERGSQDYNRYLDRLQGAQGQGAQFAQTGAGMAGNFGSQLMGMRYGYGQQQAGNEISYANAQAANRGTGVNNLLNLAGTAARAFAASDRRVKTNIDRIGTLPSGLAVYAFDYVWGGPRQTGVMAQEVALRIPDAVIVTDSGMLMVDYARVF
jgi:hypothetical protein